MLFWLQKNSHKNKVPLVDHHFACAQEQDGEEEMEQHDVEQDLLDEDDQLLLLHDDLAYEP